MSVAIKSKAIKMAADLLRRRPSTDKDDFPNVPNYYFHHVDHYAELGRRAAIMLRDMESTIHIQQAEIQHLKCQLKTISESAVDLLSMDACETHAGKIASMSLDEFTAYYKVTGCRYCQRAALDALPT